MTHKNLIGTFFGSFVGAEIKVAPNHGDKLGHQEVWRIFKDFGLLYILLFPLLTFLLKATCVKKYICMYIHTLHLPQNFIYLILVVEPELISFIYLHFYGILLLFLNYNQEKIWYH